MLLQRRIFCCSSSITLTRVIIYLYIYHDILFLPIRFAPKPSIYPLLLLALCQSLEPIWCHPPVKNVVVTLIIHNAAHSGTHEAFLSLLLLFLLFPHQRLQQSSNCPLPQICIKSSGNHQGQGPLSASQRTHCPFRPPPLPRLPAGSVPLIRLQMLCVNPHNGQIINQ